METVNFANNANFTNNTVNFPHNVNFANTENFANNDEKCVAKNSNKLYIIKHGMELWVWQ